MRSFFAVIVSACTALFITVPAAAQELVPLNLYYSPTREDNHTTAIPSRQEQALREGYRFVRTEACLFRNRELGTVPLTTYYSRAREEHISVASGTGRGDANAAGYGVLSDPEGYVSTVALPGLVPVYLYYNDDREDNYTTATAAGQVNAQGDSYRQVRIEGYARPATDCAAIPSSDASSQYFILFDSVTCSGRCEGGSLGFQFASTPDGEDLRIGPRFDLDGERTFILNYGFLIDSSTDAIEYSYRSFLANIETGIGVARNTFTIDREDGVVALGTPHTQTATHRARSQEEDSTLTTTFRIFRASP